MSGGLRPGRADLVDAGFLVVMGMLALIGFRTTYTGWSYLVVGVVGLLLGIIVGHLANAIRQPMITVAAMTVAVFFLLGGAVALRGQALAGVLPTADTLRGLAEGGVLGWKRLLTTLPPVDGAGPLLVIPYVLGLCAGSGGFALARRIGNGVVPLVVPAALLAGVILLGTTEPAAQLLQGVAFACVALCWVAVQSFAARPSIAWTKRNGAPVAQACGLQAVGYGTGKRLIQRSKPANASGSRKPVNAAASSCARAIRFASSRKP